MIKRYDFEYIALNPGASYRGLHDSLVNHGENDPPMLLCQHEKIAVQIAHGYARAKGKPMIAIVHNFVGLLHAPMGVYYAYLDRAPVFHHRRHRADGRAQAPSIHRLDSHSQRSGRSDPQFRQVGLSTHHSRRRARRIRARLFGDDERAPGADLYGLRRRPAGSAARSRCRDAAARRGHRSHGPIRRSGRAG